MSLRSFWKRKKKGKEFEGSKCEKALRSGQKKRKHPPVGCSTCKPSNARAFKKKRGFVKREKRNKNWIRGSKNPPWELNVRNDPEYVNCVCKKNRRHSPTFKNVCSGDVKKKTKQRVYFYFLSGKRKKTTTQKSRFCDHLQRSCRPLWAVFWLNYSLNTLQRSPMQSSQESWISP